MTCALGWLHFCVLYRLVPPPLQQRCWGDNAACGHLIRRPHVSTTLTYEAPCLIFLFRNVVINQE